MIRFALLIWLVLGAVAQAQVPTVYPGSTGSQTAPLTSSTIATTGAFTATLTGAAGKWTYICGFVITSGGTTAAVAVNSTIVGVAATGPMNFTYVFPSTGQGVLGVAFPQCIISSAVNTSIVVSVPAGGTGTVAALSVWGYLN